MNPVQLRDRSCHRYREYFDACVDNELPMATYKDLHQHLHCCGECAAILEDRMHLKSLVRRAVEAQNAPPDFLATLKARIRSEKSGVFGRDTTRW